MAGVSCISKRVCIAVGYYENEGYVSPKGMLAARWNGTKWSLLKISTPIGGTESQLYGVSCSSKSACTAVGDYVKDGTVVALAERWNGTKWSLQRTPNPTGNRSSELEGVFCTSKDLCTAVGWLDSSSRGRYAPLTLAERWNGTSWSLQTTPNAGGAENVLYGISCTSKSACTAAGYSRRYGATTRALAARWNGTTWSLQTLRPPVGTPSELKGVSCTSKNACTAVGFYAGVPSSPSRALVERWNGTKWSFQSTPLPTGNTSSELEGVACSSTSVCTAVGDYFKQGAGAVTLAERWNRG